MNASPQATKAVREFLDALGFSAGEIVKTAGFESSGVSLRSFVEGTWSGARPASGIAGSVQYETHGRIGCRMQSVAGCVDVDVFPGGAAQFDPWRVQQFARSRDTEIDVADLELACMDMARTGAISKVRAGWYSVTPQMDRPTPGRGLGED